jgi:hypothetical protein
VYRLIRRGGAVLIAAALVAIVVCDLDLRGFAGWWDKHAVTTSIVSSLLIVGATALIFNEVVAYRQRRERSLSVAAQSLIVYSQARLAYQAVMAGASDPSAPAGTPDELRDLASNLLVASPNLFDDPPARDFLLQLDRLMAELFAAANGRADRPGGQRKIDRLTDQMNHVQASFQPLMARFPAGYQQRVRDADGETDTDSADGTSGDSTYPPSL